MEGIIKFKINQLNTNGISSSEFDLINPYRNYCFDNQLIGLGEDGIGFGNISCRSGVSNQFVITASETGGESSLMENDYSKVVEFDLDNNTIEYEGINPVSSESMTHAAIYSANQAIQSIIHFHHAELWQNHLNLLPTTDLEIEYGTVDMAKAVKSLVISINEDNGVIIMGGHQDGIIAFGSDFDSCVNQIEIL